MNRNPDTTKMRLAQAKRFHTLAGRESRRADKLRWHERAMEQLFAILPPSPNSRQGKLLW